MTWERFFETGAVEDYLAWKGLGQGKQEAGERAAEAKKDGTVDNSDGYGAGGVSLRRL